MRALMAAGADLEARDANGKAPCHIAAGRGRPSAIEQLLLAGARWDAKDNYGWSPVHCAAAADAAEAVAALAALAEGGADLTARTGGKGRTPLHCAAFFGQVAAIKCLLQQGVDLEARDDDGGTALHVAAYKGDQLAAVEALLEAGADIAARCSKGWTPLHDAASGGCIKVMRALLEAGSDIGAKNNGGRAPIHVAAAEGQVAAVLELAAAGVDINSLSDEGLCCLHYFALHVCATEVPEAPQQLSSLLSAGSSAMPTGTELPTPVDLLLSLHRQELVQESYNYIPELIRMLAAAGCPLDGTAGIAGRRHQSTFACWLARRPAQESLWPQPLSAGDLAVAEALLQCSASQRYLVQEVDLRNIMSRGDKRLLQATLEVFPRCLQQLHCTLFPAGSSNTTSAGTYFTRQLRRLPVPPEGVLSEQHRSLVLHFCELADMLLAAGCPPQSIFIRGRQVPGSVRRLGLGRTVAVQVPGWAVEMLSFLPLLAAGVEWSPENHPDFPPALRAAARELLTINQCRGFGVAAAPSPPAPAESGGLRVQREQVQGIKLPDDALHYILRLAAHPILTWVPQLSGTACV